MIGAEKMSVVEKFGFVSVEDYVTLIQEFSANLLRGNFYGNKCNTCNRKYFPPRSGCEEFHNDMENYSISTDAELKAFTIIHFAPDNMADKAPYVVAIGEIEPGLRVLAHLVGITSKPKVGMKMKLKMQKLSEDRAVYKFAPV